MSNGEFCIDVVQEWVGEQGFLTTAFVDRGDPAAYDRDKTTLTLDGAWHDFDLSSIIGENSRAVALLLIVKAPAVNLRASFRKNGNVNSANISNIYTQIANIFYSVDLVVAVDDNRVIEYWFQNAVWTDIFLIAKGWWL